MKAMKIYVTLDDFSNYIKRRLSPDDIKEFEDCTFVPLKLEFNIDTDMSIEATVVPVKDGNVDDIRGKGMIFIETCPKCGCDLYNLVICTNPPIPRKECHRCGWSWTGKPEEVVRVPTQVGCEITSNHFRDLTDEEIQYFLAKDFKE